jgi:hypothetical protein
LLEAYKNEQDGNKIINIFTRERKEESCQNALPKHEVATWSYMKGELKCHLVSFSIPRRFKDLFDLFSTPVK